MGFGEDMKESSRNSPNNLVNKIIFNKLVKLESMEKKYLWDRWSINVLNNAIDKGVLQVIFALIFYYMMRILDLFTDILLAIFIFLTNIIKVLWGKFMDFLASFLVHVKEQAEYNRQKSESKRREDEYNRQKDESKRRQDQFNRQQAESRKSKNQSSNNRSDNSRGVYYEDYDSADREAHHRVFMNRRHADPDNHDYDFYTNSDDYYDNDYDDYYDNYYDDGGFDDYGGYDGDYDD